MTEKTNGLRKITGRNGCLDFAASFQDNPLAIEGTEFDHNPWLLGVQNGVVDLRTGTLTAGSPEQMVSLAVDPEIILFDEPTSSLDPERVGEVLAIIKDLANKKRCSMLIVTHEMNFVMEISDKVFFMDDGMCRIYSDPLK